MCARAVANNNIAQRSGTVRNPGGSRAGRGSAGFMFCAPLFVCVCFYVDSIRWWLRPH